MWCGVFKALLALTSNYAAQYYLNQALRKKLVDVYTRNDPQVASVPKLKTLAQAAARNARSHTVDLIKQAFLAAVPHEGGGRKQPVTVRGSKRATDHATTVFD